NDRWEKFIVEFSKDESESPILMDFIISRFQGYIDEVVTLTSHKGYEIRDLKELQEVVKLLFSSSLQMLQATSIHSNHPTLQSYKGYWDHPTFGHFFDARNNDFLSNGGTIQRIYICDSLGSALRGKWFKEMALNQVLSGATVKVVQI